MGVSTQKLSAWVRRKIRTRKKVSGTKQVLRLNVYRSNRHMYAQLIDDVEGKTVASLSTLSKDIRKKAAKGKKVDAAKLVGEALAKAAREKGVERVVFDRSGYIYHGRVKALADGARAAGLKF